MLHRLLSDIVSKNIWVEQSKDYIFKHLHEKIRIQDIAEYLHLNANYLSELFRQCENVTLTDFILQEKVKLTRNLLAYSPSILILKSPLIWDFPLRVIWEKCLKNIQE